MHKLAIAESCSVGSVCRLYGQIPGASHTLAGGLCAYNIDVKCNLLKVDRQNAKKYNCVNKQVALEMVTGCCQLFDTKVGISTTGYTDYVNGYGFPTCFIGIHVDGQSWVYVVQIFKENKSRVDCQNTFAYVALDCLEKKLRHLNLPETSKIKETLDEIQHPFPKEKYYEVIEQTME